MTSIFFFRYWKNIWMNPMNVFHNTECPNVIHYRTPKKGRYQFFDIKVLNYLEIDSSGSWKKSSSAWGHIFYIRVFVIMKEKVLGGFLFIGHYTSFHNVIITLRGLTCLSNWMCRELIHQMCNDHRKMNWYGILYNQQRVSLITTVSITWLD